jgi:membrane-associated phospholipid phosphatase
VGAFVAMYRFFVLTSTGQNLDTLALASNGLGAQRLAGPVNNVLEAISIVAVAVATCIIGFIALIRQRFALAVTSVVLVGGANLSAELFKHYLSRPNLGIDEARAGAGNSFPSGHTAIAASVVVALVLVLPPAARGIGAVIGSLYVATVGVATMSAGWHRPSDAVGAILVVGVWAALAGILLRFLRRRGERVSDDESHKVACLALASIGAVALVVAVVGMKMTYDAIGTDTELLSTKRQAAAYVGSAAGILATSCLVIAAILLTVHRIVPKRVPVTPRSARAAKTPQPASTVTAKAARTIKTTRTNGAPANARKTAASVAKGARNAAVKAAGRARGSRSKSVRER